LFIGIYCRIADQILGFVGDTCMLIGIYCRIADQILGFVGDTRMFIGIYCRIADQIHGFRLLVILVCFIIGFIGVFG
jgi:hypothetical protein